VVLIAEQSDFISDMALNKSPFLHVLIFVERHATDNASKSATLADLTLDREWNVPTVAGWLR
jgi:hypothetical protein